MSKASKEARKAYAERIPGLCDEIEALEKRVAEFKAVAEAAVEHETRLAAKKALEDTPMTPDEADRIIAEKVMGWHVEKRWQMFLDTGDQLCDTWVDENGKDMGLVETYKPSSNLNQLRKAEERLTEEQREAYIALIVFALTGASPEEQEREGVQNSILFDLRHAPAVVCAQAMLDAVKEDTP